MTSLRQRNKILAGGVEVLSEMAEVQREAIQYLGAELLRAMERCARCDPGPPVSVCHVCLSVQETMRRHLNSIQAARVILDAYVEGVASRTQGRATAPPNRATTGPDAPMDGAASTKGDKEWITQQKPRPG